MTNRTNKKLQEFKELINRDWQLSLDEDEFLDSVLNLLLSRETKKAAEIVNFFYSEEWDSLLELIPDRQIRYYAERDLNMIDEDDCDCEEQLTLEDFDNEELIAEIYDRGYTTFLPCGWYSSALKGPPARKIHTGWAPEQYRRRTGCSVSAGPARAGSR